MPQSAIAKRLWRPVIGLLAVAGLVLGANKVGLAADDISTAVARIGNLNGLILLVLACAGMWGFSAVSALVLDRYEDDVDFPHALAVTLSSQLGKYLPTGMGAVVARAEVYKNGAGGRKRSYAYVLFTTACQLAGGAVVAVAAFAVNRQGIDARVLVAVAALGAANLVVGVYLGMRLDVWHPDAGNAGVRAWSGRTALITALHVAPWLVAAVVPVLCFHWLGIGVGVSEGIFASVVSWIAGMLVFVLPAGVGVREVLFTSILFGVSPVNAGLVAVISRALYTVADLIGGVAALVWLRLRD